MAISDAVKLKLYNEALALLKETKLASLSEAREPRRRLDDAWDAGLINAALEKGQWHFASRVVALTYDPDVTLSLPGYTYAVEKPSDMVRLTAFCSDGTELRVPVLDYRESGAYWLCNFDTVYIGYVSNDGSYGNDPTLWPASFREVVEVMLAEKGMPIGADEALIDRIQYTLRARVADAVAKGAMAGPTRFMPPGSWSRARSHGAGRFDHNRR
jgi:hypothetical protein